VSVHRARFEQLARETETIASQLSTVEARLRAVSTSVTRLIGGAAGREDRTMNGHLGNAAAISRQAHHTLRQAADSLRRLTPPAR
jgi:hypothetical protein